MAEDTCESTHMLLWTMPTNKRTLTAPRPSPTATWAPKAIEHHRAALPTSMYRRARSRLMPRLPQRCRYRLRALSRPKKLCLRASLNSIASMAAWVVCTAAWMLLLNALHSRRKVTSIRSRLSQLL